jgi:hypothetical protein
VATRSEVLADRYGRRARRPAPRWVRWALLGVFVVAGLVVAVVGYRNLGAQPIEADETGFVVQDDHAVQITFTVTRDQPERPAVCIVRARDANGSETGRREVLIVPGAGTVRSTTLLHTIARPNTGEVFGCSYQVPAYLSTR